MSEFRQAQLPWKEIELCQIAEVQTGPFGSQLKNEQYITGGTPVVTVEHIQDFRIKDFKYPSITDDDKQRLNKYLMKEGDILFTRVGSVDISAYVNKHQNGWMFSSRMLRVRPKNEINSRFLSYFFQQKKFREYILNISVGATMPSINTGILKTIPISYPQLPEQKAIAKVLSSLDDKIDLLHRQNKTLEQMAETLFRQWFVEEAKEDWEEGVLENLVDVKYGKDHKKLLDGNIPVYGSGGIMRYAEKALFEDESVLIPRKGTLNNVTYINEPFWTVDTMFYTIMKKPNLAKFIYHFVKEKDLASMNVGSAVPSMTTQVLNNMPLQIPFDEDLEYFENTVTPCYQKIKTNNSQINTLEKMRDTLLPKLMSGEMKFKK
ncbi:MAG: restriction endonuclease subunit S [Bacteroidetes bacterium]|nr:restriction endonuclease subunit S [Bacteroidota bacterium]MBT6687396.1 restriction endonuclease subunit S [Bacteroidota bacterium]MBT7142600.1 restriction endonuclease subunit S [Bacteroidota bacterium]MBT7490131.1 restriction endonuclease subunit S [Bacteroidota bacterium]